MYFLGTFEESVLHGRLEPVSTVQGFTAELGASGLFCPNHKTFPVTVFFYSLGDMDRMSVPYLVNKSYFSINFFKYCQIFLKTLCTQCKC